MWRVLEPEAGRRCHPHMGRLPRDLPRGHGAVMCARCRPLLPGRCCAAPTPDAAAEHRRPETPFPCPPPPTPRDEIHEAIPSRSFPPRPAAQDAAELEDNVFTVHGGGLGQYPSGDELARWRRLTRHVTLEALARSGIPCGARVSPGEVDAEEGAAVRSGRGLAGGPNPLCHPPGRPRDHFARLWDSLASLSNPLRIEAKRPGCVRAQCLAPPFSPPRTSLRSSQTSRARLASRPSAAGRRRAPCDRNPRPHFPPSLSARPGPRAFAAAPQSFSPAPHRIASSRRRA